MQSFPRTLQATNLYLVTVYEESWLTHPQFLAGLALFFVGMAINIHSDDILINLRKPGETGYKIPRVGSGVAAGLCGTALTLPPTGSALVPLVHVVVVPFPRLPARTRKYSRLVLVHALVCAAVLSCPTCLALPGWPL